MAPTRNKRTYSKTITTVPKTDEERRKRYKTRKVVPSFVQLFLNGDENKTKTPYFSKKGKNAISDTIFEDSLADFQLPPPSTRKPLSTRNADNTPQVASSHSSCSSLNENDTFDKLFSNTRKVTVKPQNKTRISQAPAVETKPNNSKSTSNSSTSYENDLLYCSLLPQRASEHFSLLMQKNRKTIKHKKDAIRNPLAQENVASPDLFDSIQHQSEDSPSSSVYSSPVPKRRTTRTAVLKKSSRDDPDTQRAHTTTTNRRNAARNTCQDTDLRASIAPKKTISSSRERKSTKVAVKDLEADWADGSEHKVLVADWTDESDENVAQTWKESKKKNTRSRIVKKVSIHTDKDNKATLVEENERVNEDMSPALHLSVKRLTIHTPEENVRLSVRNSYISHNSLSDVVTSTPASQSTCRRIPSNGTPWGVQLAPMLEDTTLSPVQRDSCIQAAFERSSVFESPMTFRSKCRWSTASGKDDTPNPHATANEENKTKIINDTGHMFSLGNEMIPVFDPDSRVSSQFKHNKSSTEYSISQSREIRRSKKSARKSQKHVSINEDRMKSGLGASGFDDNENSLQENNSIKSVCSNERSLSLMQISLSEILQNYNKKRRRGTILKKITDHETTSELIKIGVLGTRTSLRFARPSTSNTPFKEPPSTMKKRQSRNVKEVKKMIESFSLSKIETSNLSIVEKRGTKSSVLHPNQHSSLAPGLIDHRSPVVKKQMLLKRSRRTTGANKQANISTDQHSNLSPGTIDHRSPVVKTQMILRRSRRTIGDNKQANISTDQETSQVITRPTRKRSFRNKKNISTDMEQSYSFIANGTINLASNNETSSNLPTRKKLKRLNNSYKNKSSIMNSSILGKSTADKDNASSYWTRSRKTDISMDSMQSTLNGSGVLSTFTRQGRKRTNKMVFTRPDTSVSDHSVMSMGDSVISIQSVNELPVIRENYNNLETDSSSNTENEKSESEQNISDKYSIEDVGIEESVDEVLDNEDTEENNYEEEDEVNENKISDQIECSDFSNVPAEMESEEVTENEKENEAISIDESVLSIEKDEVFLNVENEPSISTHIKSCNLSGVLDTNTAHINKKLSVLEKSNYNNQSKVDMSIGEPIEVIEKFDELNLDKQETSMLEVDNSYNKSVSMIELENTSKLKPNPVLEVKEYSNIQSASMLELEDAFESFMKPGVKIPTKPGKGWRRSLNANLLASFNESISLENKEQLDYRRKTVHRISGSKLKEAVVNISRLPVELENKFHQRSSLVPLTTASRLSQRKGSSSYCVRKSSLNVPSDPREHVLQLCGQLEPLPLSGCFSQSRLSCCKKIGEGVYGEVFMSRPNPNSMEGATVLKIMPIEGDFEINGERQKKFHEILSEIVISVELSNLRLASKTRNWCETYVNVLKCWCLEGQYLPELLTFWDNFHAEKGSENDRPDQFPENQLYIVLEFSHGGTDLEGYVFNSAAQSLAIFRQIVMSLAVAEQELEFEHRDLHWGNVLVAPTKDTTITFKVAGQDYNLNTQGVRATIIDFTLSRLNAPHCVVYNNLGEDPDLFVAEGDYQFEIYRQMKKTNNNNWESFNPYTNVLWLHYVLDKMMNECYYKKITTKVHKTNQASLNQIKNRMLKYKSSTEFIQNE